MRIWNRIKNKIYKRGQPAANGSVVDFFKSLGLSIDDVESSSELSEMIYFICMKHLSETMSKMPWEIIEKSELKGKEKKQDSNLDFILNTRPNPYYSASDLWASVELNRLHHGNAYIYIERDYKGALKHLWSLPSSEVKIWMDDRGLWGTNNSIWYEWTDSKRGKSYKFFSDEIIHLKTSTSFDGISGIPVRELLLTQINSNKHSQAFLNKLYKSNMFGSKIMLHYTGELNSKFVKKLASELETYSTSVGSGKFIPLPLGVEAKLLDMKLADAQFFENNRVSALQLAAVFGIKPNVINNYDKSSYSNSETQQLDFYVNTLQPLFANYEQELTYKILTPTQLKKNQRLVINTKVLFKMDNKTQAEVYGKYVSNFIMTPNEAREELNLPYKDGADKLIGNGSTISIDDIGSQYKKEVNE